MRRTEFVIGVEVGVARARAMLMEICHEEATEESQKRIEQDYDGNGYAFNLGHDRKERDEGFGYSIINGSATPVKFAISSTREVKLHVHHTSTHDGKYFEHSSEDIWDAVCEAIAGVVEDVEMLESSFLTGANVALAFCADEALVCLDRKGKPISVRKAHSSRRSDRILNVISSLDRRADVHAAMINEIAKDSNELRLIGGKMSGSMILPKICWLQDNLRTEDFQRIGHFMSLTDYLTFMATGQMSRSFNCLSCSWNYMSKSNDEASDWQSKTEFTASAAWNKKFLDNIGLGDLSFRDKFQRIGIPRQVIQPGAFVGCIQNNKTAFKMGIHSTTQVRAGLVASHAGLVGSLTHGCLKEFLHGSSLVVTAEETFSHILFSGTQPHSIKRIKTCETLPSLYCNEACINTGGIFLDDVISKHPVSRQLKARFDTKNSGSFSLYEHLENMLHDIQRKQSRTCDHFSKLARHVHVIPDCSGNVTIHNAAEVPGVISGIKLQDSSLESLAILYLATVQGLVYTTKTVIDHIKNAGKKIDHVIISGSYASILHVQTLADVLDPIQVSTTSEKNIVLFGACVAASIASSGSVDLLEAMGLVNTSRWHSKKKGKIKLRLVAPNPTTSTFHHKKYQVFLEHSKAARQHVDQMNSVS